MTVTKQQQLEWLAKNHEAWPSNCPVMIMSDKSIGTYYGSPIPGCHFVSFTEWQQERDKMSSKPEVDKSWHERGELPQVGTICEVLNSELYNPAWEKCTIIFMGEYKCIYSSETRSEIVGNVGSTGAIEFRPLRTEREKAIDEMMSLVMDGLMSHEMAKELVIKLHGAGYRKVKP